MSGATLTLGQCPNYCSIFEQLYKGKKKSANSKSYHHNDRFVISFFPCNVSSELKRVNCSSLNFELANKKLVAT